MNGSELIDTLIRTLGVSNDSELANLLGVTAPSISHIRTKPEAFTSRRIAGLFAKALARKEKLNKAALRENDKEWEYEVDRSIIPIVEFFPIERCQPRNKGRQYIFPIGKKAGNVHKRVRKELEHCHGVYSFYNSEGKLLYVGKADGTTLWTELISTYNRERPKNQNVFLANKQINGRFVSAYSQINESGVNNNQIKLQQMYLYEIASFFSAYSVRSEMIHNIEALLIRIAPNNNMNRQIAKFTYRH